MEFIEEEMMQQQVLMDVQLLSIFLLLVLIEKLMDRHELKLINEKSYHSETIY